jgi:hypothetical protein
VKRLLKAIWAVVSSRALPPLVCGVFLLTYIGIAFGTDETLTALMEFTRKSVILAVLLALIPLNSLCRIVLETDRHLKRRRALTGAGTDAPAELFDASVSLQVSPPHAAELPTPDPLGPIGSRSFRPDRVPVPPTASSAFAELEGRLGAVGYRCRRTESALAAWRGISIFPARLLFIAGTFCLFAGILVSLTARSTHRVNVLEGEPLPTAKGGGGLVEKISLKASSGAILDKILTLEVAPSAAGDGRKAFGLYPPSLYRGYFVYPRYLGIAPVIRFSAPDMQSVFEQRAALNIYPPGREDRLEIPGSPYQIVISMATPDDGSDPYMTGRITFNFKLSKGKDLLMAGSVPAGGELAREGFRLAIPDFKRMVTTDFILDYGVLLVWTAAILFLGAVCIGLPVRVFLPRREMLFTSGADGIRAHSRAEGGRRRHGGVFHEALDLLEVRRLDVPGTLQAARATSAGELAGEGTKD